MHDIIEHYNDIVRYVTIVYEGFENRIQHVCLKIFFLIIKLVFISKMNIYLIYVVRKFNKKISIINRYDLNINF